jgi:hypothetical protein
MKASLVKIILGKDVISFGIERIYTCNFHIFRKIWIEIGIECFHAMSLSSHKFRDRRCSESHTSLRGVNKLLLRFDTFYIDLNKIPCRKYSQSCPKWLWVSRKTAQWRHSCTDRRQQNSVGTLRIYSPVWLNCSIMYRTITLLCICEFRTIHIREGFIFPGDLNESAFARVRWNRVA